MTRNETTVARHGSADTVRQYGRPLEGGRGTPVTIRTGKDYDGYETEPPASWARQTDRRADAVI
jgi:hypothetical protein